MTTIAIHEADGQRVTLQTEIAYSLVTGGASPAKDTHAYYLFMKNQITLTEKRFFEWHEDNVSVTLRNKGGSYGGGQKC